jgi:ribosomal protein S18 acetylase RimI-like enzyme
MRHAPAAIGAAAPYLARRSTLRKLAETALYPGRRDDLPAAELLSIAVAPEARRAGIAGRLAGATLSELARRGVDEVKVVVDERNAPANTFYRSVGGRPAGTVRVHDGITSNVWVIPCRS